MTREEAIKIINCYDIGFYDLSGEKIPADKLVEAFDMAIEALEQEPIVRCKDCRHAERQNYPLPDGRQIVFCRKYRKERFTTSDGYCECGERVKE